MAGYLINQDKQTPPGWVSRILPGAALFILTVIFLHSLVSLKFITIGHVEDHLRHFYPNLTYDAEMIKSLTFPLWNPYTFGGFPYLASLRSHIFYPPNLIFLILPTYLGMNALYVVEIFLSGIFMFWLGKTLRMNSSGAFVSAVSFMFCGFLIDKVSWGHLDMLDSACWVPLLYVLFIKAVENRKTVYAVSAGVVFAIAIFSGHPQLPYYGILLLFFFTLYSFFLALSEKKSFKTAVSPAVYLLILVLVGIGLSAIQTIPAAELTSYSLRTLFEDRYAFYTRWSMEFPHLLTFILPRISPVIGTNTYPFPMSQGYIGVLPLLLAVISLCRVRKDKYVLFFWFAAFLSIIFALGRYTPVYYLFYQYFPGFDAFRNPVFFLYPYVFSVAILSGFGMDFIQHIIPMDTGKRLRLFTAAIILICFLLILVASTTYLLSYVIEAGADNSANFFNSAFINRHWTNIQKYRISLIYDFAVTAFILGTAALSFILWNRKKINGTLLSVTIVFLIFIELFVYGRNFIRVYDLTPFVSGGKWVDFIKKDRQPYRVLPMLPYPEQDPVLKLNKIPSINGYGSLEIMQDYVNYIGAFQEEPVHQGACLTRVTNYNSQAVDLFNTKYILTDETIKDDKFQLVFTGEIPQAKTWDPYNKEMMEIRVYENKAALPRAFIVRSARVIKDRNQILETIKNPGFNPRDTIILEEETHAVHDNDGSDEEADQVSFTDYRENEFSLEASLAKKGYLFLSEIYYPGWKAFVDGEEKRILRADYLFRSLLLDEGKHTIKFIYRPLSFRIGAIVTLTTLLALIVLLIYCAAENRQL